MKKVKNVVVDIPERYMRHASEGGLLMIDTSGGHTSVAQFLSGDNLWGLHQDRYFSGSISQILLGQEIVDAAENAEDEILLTDAAHDALLRVLARPEPSEVLPLHPALARACLPIFRAIEEAEEA